MILSQRAPPLVPSWLNYSTYVKDNGFSFSIKDALLGLFICTTSFLFIKIVNVVSDHAKSIGLACLWCGCVVIASTRPCRKVNSTRSRSDLEQTFENHPERFFLVVEVGNITATVVCLSPKSVVIFRMMKRVKRSWHSRIIAVRKGLIAGKLVLLNRRNGPGM